MACVKPAKTATTAHPIASPVHLRDAAMECANHRLEKIVYPAHPIAVGNRTVPRKIASVAEMGMESIPFPARTTDAQQMDLPAVRNLLSDSVAVILYVKARKQAAIAESIAASRRRASSRELVAQTEKMMIAMARSIAMIQTAAAILFVRHHLSLVTTMVCESGENCNNCGNDCSGKSGGKPSQRYCCGDGIQQSAEGNGAVCDNNY